MVGKGPTSTDGPMIVISVYVTFGVGGPLVKVTEALGLRIPPSNW